MVLSLIASLAAAGKLEDGWRGIAYGPASVLQSAPTADCVKSAEPGVWWACQEAIGGVPVAVHYVGSDGWFVGVHIRAQGYSNCATVFETLKSAWDAPFTKKQYASGVLPDGFWNLMKYKTVTSAAWSYNQYSDVCTASTMNAALSVEVDAAKARRAEAAATEL